MIALLVLFFALAAVGDVLAVWWHRAREERRVVAVVALSAALETLSWVPVYFAVTTEDWRIVVVTVAGSAFGTAIGMARASAK